MRLSLWAKPIIIAIIVAGLLAVLVAAIVVHSAPGQKAYTVAAVLDGLRHDPAVWNGRTVLVHGWYTGVRACIGNAGVCYRWDLIEPVPDNGPGLPGINAPMHVCGAALPGQEPLVMAFAPGVHRPSNNGAAYAPSDSVLLHFVSRLPIVGSLVPPSALYRGLIFYVRVIVPHPCRRIPHPPFALPSPNVVLLSDAH